MGGNYPDGVTGGEYEIAGPDREWDDVRTVSCQNEECEDFDVEKDLPLSLSSYRSDEWGTFECPVCKTQGEYEGTTNYEDGPDPDEAYERMRDEDSWYE